MGDYKRDTSHLSLLEHGVYTVMLDDYYATHQPLTSNEERLYRQLRAITKEEIEAVQKILKEFWVKTEDGWINPRAYKEIKNTEAYSRKQSESAQKRWQKKNKNLKTRNS